jgi:hypothetical protein
MIKLKEVIVQLEESKFLKIEQAFVENKADKFLFLFKAYKSSNLSDEEIKKNMGVSSNSFYVLKSRLYDKIQESISSDLYLDKESTIKLLLQVPDLCYNTHRETAVAYLLKLEKELKRFEMHQELLVVYSALKKIHLNSDKYYHYSQLYNKQVSYVLSLEKAEELLANFCRILAQYDFSKSDDFYEQLCLLKKEIKGIYVFCNSRKIQLINNLMELQLMIFGRKNKLIDLNTDELLQKTKTIFDEFPSTIIYKKWEVVLNYLCFEYYYSIGSNKAAGQYLDKVNSQLTNFLLFGHVGLVSNFFNTKIKFCLEFDKHNEISIPIDIDKLCYDIHDLFTQMRLREYNAMVYFCQKNYKKAITILSDIKNEFVFKDFFHEFLNLNLTLTYFYIVAEQFDEAQFCLKTLNRRIKAENSNSYNHVTYLLKAFDFEINKDITPKNILKQKELLMLFFASNSNNDYQILNHLLPLIKNKYQI